MFRARHSIQSRRITRALALASGFAFLLTASMASAGHEDRRRARRHKVVYHDDYCSARSDYRNDSYRRQDSYTCEPCGHRFQSRSRFHRHLHRHHHISLFALPFVIVKHTLGWIFYG